MPNGNISMGVRVPFPQTFPQVRIQPEMQNSSMAGRHIFRFFRLPFKKSLFPLERFRLGRPNYSLSIYITTELSGFLE